MNNTHKNRVNELQGIRADLKKFGLRIHCLSSSVTMRQRPAMAFKEAGAKVAEALHQLSIVSESDL